MLSKSTHNPTTNKKKRQTTINEWFTWEVHIRNSFPLKNAAGYIESKEEIQIVPRDGSPNEAKVDPDSDPQLETNRSFTLDSDFKVQPASQPASQLLIPLQLQLQLQLQLLLLV